MLKILTFLGKYPKLTSYEFAGKVYQGQVFAEAMRQFLDFDQMLVCITAEAKHESWPVLDALGDPRIIPVPIPTGESPDEMWDIFKAILPLISEKDDVIFDITHGLRSLPFLVFLFAAYLKSAKDVNIQAIYYGALELGDQKSGKPAPVIDLSSFIRMLDWLAATDQFVQTGNAHRLAPLLNPSNEIESKLSLASNSLLAVSQAALLCQPFKLSEAVTKLRPALHDAESELDQAVYPFQILRDQILNAFEKFKFPKGDVQAKLQAEYDLIEWFYSKGQMIQAMILAREWLIDAVTFKLGKTIEYGGTRQDFERAISGLALVGRSHPQEDRKFLVDDLNEFGKTIYQKWPEAHEIRMLWTPLQNVRNRLSHAEHQYDAWKVEKILQKITNEVIPHLEILAKTWGFTHSNRST